MPGNKFGLIRVIKGDEMAYDCGCPHKHECEIEPRGRVLDAATPGSLRMSHEARDGQKGRASSCRAHGGAGVCSSAPRLGRNPGARNRAVLRGGRQYGFDVYE